MAQNLFPHATLFEVAGMVGFFCYVTNYLRLTFNRVSSASRSYFALNIIASALVLASLTANFNLPAAMLQSFWLVVSTLGFGLRSRRGPAT
ncbi:hypothetical protein SAMN05421688_1455 [Poseidonocella pacifica]|uniref:CBU-0592-like domain-containing protein n=1 Tax=Poseidonocella pacifica TaxID=871651 RepID=A0A1I0WIP8_9RHOB|nr:hypothetical protein [Poseidonocella pacifica]SFA88257.1 hypothetical protein SAMN05421688_1455 [Poseidonocella pacifica]